MNACVYVLADGGGFCKIGASTWGNSRVREVHSPAHIARWAVACTQRHQLAYSIEAAWHARLCNLRFVAAPGAAAIKGQTEWFRLSVDDALDTVANVWKEKAGEDIMWHWDDSSWGWRPRFGASCDK